MRHREFLLALRSLMEAYALLDRALVAAAPGPLGAVLKMDPLSRAAGEEFAHPLVQWFHRSSRLRGVAVADGTLVFDVPAGGSGPVLFLPGTAAKVDADLEEGWRDGATSVALVTGESEVLAVHDEPVE